ncbi:GPALPP motifs-containing protein 1 [Coregonus clupeaformis]|uniref:GPALPP motifs-containing protein 1 n=1 Tax=Coregonus clupeaformis TaxID=59861 RepID=UPI001E1C8CBF|nr:GPALPP motifs-containing protein 1 [Coregonus clupeaformis]
MSDDDLIGPALPPSFRKSSHDDSDDEGGFAGPALPPGYKPELLSSSEDDFGQEEEEEEEEVIKRRSKTSSKHDTSSRHGHGSATTRDGPTAEKQRRVDETVSRRLADDDEDDGFFGPALPPGFSKSQASPERPAVLGPALPPGFHRPAADEDDDDGDDLHGPALPPGFHRPAADEDDDDLHGPALPPGFHRPAADEDDDDLHGPALPPGFHRPAADEDDDGDDLHGPALPPGYTAEPSSSDEEEEEEDEEVIGPMPAQGAIQDSVALDIERRAQKMKDRLTGADDGPEEVVRETWMTELPPTLQHIGLGARTFKKRAGPESKDRSLWTDTPADRERKLRERLEGKKSEEIESVPQLSHKELQMAEKVSKYNETKRGESLISLHEKQLKKRKLDEGAKSVERRAFDRDQDLQVNKFDEAQKQRLLKKSQELNTRFGHSKEKMFL